MSPTECTAFHACSAPLCPLSDMPDDFLWYPDEPVCTKFNHEWIRAQRKIAQRARDREKCFTVKMLKRNCQIRSGIIGIDPDGDIEEQEKRWLRKHSEKRKPTESEKAKRRELMKTINQERVRNSAQNRFKSF